jgi:hypothetical protein
MRKANGIIMGIIMFAFGGMMVAANMALKPLKQYAEIGREVTAVMRNLDFIEPGSKVFAMPRPGAPERLATDGWGMLVEFQPSAMVRSRKGRLERVAYRALDEASALYARGKARPLEWFEIKLVLPDGVVHRSLLRVDAATKRLSKPEPPLPAVWPLPAPVETAKRPGAPEASGDEPPTQPGR